MTEVGLERAVEGVTALRGVFITLMPDCLLFDAWMRPGSEWVPEDVASYFGDLVRANREGLRALRSWSAEMQVTIESADSLVVLRELQADFVASFVFDRETPLGMVRLAVKRMLGRIVTALPQIIAEQRPRAIRLVEFLQRYAPDPHAAMLRVSLQTGILLEVLERPESIDERDLEPIEESVKDILGLEALAH